MGPVGRALAGLALLVAGSATAAPARPPYDEYARAARYVVARGAFGVMATAGDHSNADLDAATPFSNVVSYSDGLYASDAHWNSTGIPYFYLTKFDPTAVDLDVNARASLTISEAMHGGCEVDPESPICWRVTLSGVVRQTSGETERHGREFVFSRHPTMATWPADHHWIVYEMEIEKIFLLDYFGGAHHFSVQEYLDAKLEDDGLQQA
mmetsp:Transcript_3941/g.9900  ORF Transcript_3941/g.9900 Transcript_3941/m.9900 type:complete len:209 (-) Transcript_3941:170-796(-)